jgi:DNA-binding response OmpR family regulator
MPGGSILIVEDDVDMCDELSEILGHEGYEVITAHDGMEGKKLFDSGDHALVILDLILPEMSGYGLLEYIKRTSRCPVLVMTGKPLETRLNKMIEDENAPGPEAVEEADGVIGKPFRIEKLIEAVARLTS